MDDRKLPVASDPGVTMMLAGKLKAAEEENARLTAENDRLRGYVEANKRNDAMVCERWADERCGECPGCLAAREDSKPGPHEQRVLDGLDPREDYTDGERDLIRGRLREAQEHDAQEAGARRGSSQPLEKENARLTARVERLRGVLQGVVDWSEDTFHAQAHCHMCDQTGDLSDLHDECCPVLLARNALARGNGAP